MKVAFLNSIEKTTYGGMEEWIRLVSGGLVRRGHEAMLIGRPDSVYLKRSAGANRAVRTAALNISGDFNPFTVRSIKRLLHSHKIDLLSVNFNKDVRLGGIAARLGRRVPVVWSVGIDITKRKWRHRFLTPRLVDRVVVPSRALKTELVASRCVKDSLIEVIPIGVEPENPDYDRAQIRRDLRIRYGLPDNALVAVTAARLVYKKGHEYLIDAATELTKRYPNLYFLFLGDGAKEPVLRQQVKQLGLESRILFAGMLDNIDRELAGSDLMIHPSKEEPFGIAILEGMRAGLPVAASRVGGIPDVVAEGETALLFEPRNPDAIIEVVSNLLSDKDRMAQLGAAGKKRATTRFRLEDMIDNIERFFLSMLPPPSDNIRPKPGQTTSTSKPQTSTQKTS